MLEGFFLPFLSDLSGNIDSYGISNSNSPKKTLTVLFE